MFFYKYNIMNMRVRKKRNSRPDLVLHSNYTAPKLFIEKFGSAPVKELSSRKTGRKTKNHQAQKHICILGPFRTLVSDKSVQILESKYVDVKLCKKVNFINGPLRGHLA